jgi:potassium uptake TrkH family protein
VPARRLLDLIRNPAQFVVAAFVSLISIGTALLSLPWAADGPGRIPVVDALFTSTSAVTVTGLATADISEFSLFGELVILLLIQVGGFGIMTIGSVFALVAARKVGLRYRMLAQTEIGGVELGELRTLILSIAKITLMVEASVAAVLFVRFWQSHAEEPASAAYSAVFHGVSSFNNAGISLYSDSLIGFATDPFVTLPITASFILGGLGFPILVQFRQHLRPRNLSLHARITLLATAILLLAGPLVVIVGEWDNPGTLGPLSAGEKLLAGWFQGVTPRTAGFNTIPIGSMNEPVLLFMTTLMFIGAGPASTAGGIKVTTFAVLGWALWAEVRGERDVNVFHRRIPDAVIRQALTVALLAVGIVIGSAMALVTITGVTLTPALFEAASAFGTVGLSTGITPTLPVLGKLLLVVVMLAGRVGPVTFVMALALRQRRLAYRYPEERPIIG